MDIVKTTNKPAVVVASAERTSTSHSWVSSYLDEYPDADFFLFVLVNALIFIRPMDVFPGLENWPLFEVPFYACLILSYRGVIEQLTPRLLTARPITACVVGLLLAVILSHLSQLDYRSGAVSGEAFSKVVLYYFLLVAVVNTPQRLRQFFSYIGIFACIHIGTAVLQQHGLIDLPALRPVEEQAIAQKSGEIVTQYRMCGAGLFHDPNHLAVLAAIAMILCLNWIVDGSDRRPMDRRIQLLFSITALALCGHGLLLTQSRGGFLAFIAGLTIFIIVRFEWKTSALLAAIVLPVIVALYSGRQTDLHMLRRTTSQMRLNFWVQGLRLFSQAPVFGIGQGNFRPRVGYEAHNSFIQCFAELGLLGGTLFLGAFFLSLWPIYRFSSGPADDGLAAGNSELRRFRPYLLALLVTWIVGMLSLTRSYAPPTYMMLGASTSYLDMAHESSARFTLNGWLVVRLLALSLAFLIGVYFFIHVFKRT